MPKSAHQRLSVLKVAVFLLAFLATAWNLFAQAPESAPKDSEAAKQGEPAPESKTAPASESATPAPAAPLKIGGYELSGVGSFGYRFVDLNGNHGKYNQLLNLQEGFRLFDAQFQLQPTEAGHGWFDRLWFTSQGLGGDPFPVMRLDVRKSGVYQLRLAYRATQYVYDLPETAFTSNHAWNDRRRFADADFRFSPVRNLGLRFFYNRTERAGNDLASSPFFYIPLAPDVWEALGRFNSVSWVVPIREEANHFGIGIDYHIAKTDLHIEQSYRTFNNPANLRGFANLPIQVLGPLSPAQNLVVQKWDTFSGFNIPTTSIHIDQEVTSRLQLRTGFIYNHASGPTSLNGVLSQPGPTPFLLNYTGAGTTKLTTETADVGFTVKVLERLDFQSDYRYQMYTENNHQSLQASRADLPTPLILANDLLRWDFGFHTLESLFLVTPIQSLSIRAGVRFLKEDIVRKTDEQTDIGTQRSWSYSPIVNAGWSPSRKFSLRGDFQSRIIVDPYVRIAPESTIGTTIRTHYSPNDKWGIDNTFSIHNLKTEDIGFTSHARSNSTNLWYQPLDKIGFTGGFAYGNFSSKNTFALLRGAPPLTGLFSTDQTIDRTYSLGVRMTPHSNWTLAFTGQFIRSTGLGTLTGETSTYGPLTWPAWSAEVGYLTRHLGRIVFGWQRSYYKEDLYRAVDYSANGFILRFERAF